MIYKPKGRAGEYADWAANLYLGCSHHCRYCYGARVLKMTQEEFDNPKPKKDVLERLEQSAHAMDKRGQHVQVLLSFVCDDYQPLDAETNITRNAIEILHKYGHNFCVLTKGGTRALRDIDKEAFDELINHARRHASAGSNTANPNPFEPIVMSILVEHEKTIRKLREHVEREHN